MNTNMPVSCSARVRAKDDERGLREREIAKMRRGGEIGGGGPFALF